MKYISSGWEKFSKMRLCRIFASAIAFCMTFLSGQLAYAENAGINWPWKSLLSDLMTELTGPLPTTLGVLGIVIAAIGLFTGQAGDGVRRILVIILAISMCIFAPKFVELIFHSAGGVGSPWG